MRYLPSTRAAADLGTCATLASYRWCTSNLVGERWRRTNYRNHEVDLFAGPAVAAGIAIGELCSLRGLAIPVAACGAAIVGHLDDVRGARAQEVADKGIAGHLAALRSGRISAGVIKVAGLVGIGLASSLLGGQRGRRDVVLDAACIAGAANLLNLFDLRPGRALKVASAVSGASMAFGDPTGAILGSSVAMLPLDLAERTMLGDSGANALGAALGASLVRNRSVASRVTLLAGITAATLTSERVSFSAVIERHPLLRAMDRWGRVKP